MGSGFEVDAAVLVGAVLLALGVVAGLVTGRLRMPGLLAFLGLGMVVADDGLALVRFDDVALAQSVSVVALAVILFEGGLATGPAAVRRVLVPGGLLATVGVVVTAAVVALGGVGLLGLDATTAWLLGAVVASTDAAAVFATFRDGGLPARVRDLLQVESGGNDPVAVLLTVGLVEAWRREVGPLEWLVFGAVQLGGGLVIGAVVGALARAALRRVVAHGAAEAAVLALAAAGVAYGTAAVSGASGFLAVYVTGLALAREPVVTGALRAVHQALAATAQATLFGILGLLVFPSQLVDDLGVAAVVTGILVFVARPVAVAVCLGWRRPSMAEGVVVAWAGLRGAVPIVLATIPLSAGHPDGAFVFDVVFVVVCLSLVLQATTVVGVARRLGLPLDPPAPASVVLVAVEGVPGGLAELRIGPDAAVAGSTLADAPLPGGALVVVIQRGDDTVVPSGATVLAAGDLLVVAGPVPGEDALVAWAGGTAPAGTGSAGTGSAGVRQAGATPRRGPGGTRRRRR